MSRILFAFFATAFLFVTPVNAGVLLEPYLGYEMGSASVKGSAGSEATYDSSGSVLGARAGLTFGLVFFAADYSIESQSWKTKNKAISDDYNVDRSTLYGVLGVKIPLFRFWLGYSLMNEYKNKTLDPQRILTGPALKVGFSYTGLPFVAINLEYVTVDFKKTSSNGVDRDIPDPANALYESAKNSMYLLSVSAPFDLF